ncbi:hypothetical protein BZA70DRAFT_280525 [Myxozyma melibiosi]|uniref:NAD(P)-binding domain-containing protein n=1 Tax=Myxozyma melibiosi TaxID=54550 RepID=A0ABR1F3B2_9ASCO
MTLSQPTVLLTGADTFVGSAILAQLLAKEHVVRAAIPSLQAANELRKRFPATPALSLAIVSNAGRNGAFDAAVKGVGISCVVCVGRGVVEVGGESSAGEEEGGEDEEVRGLLESVKRSCVNGGSVKRVFLVSLSASENQDRQTNAEKVNKSSFSLHIHKLSQLTSPPQTAPNTPFIITSLIHGIPLGPSLSPPSPASLATSSDLLRTLLEIPAPTLASIQTKIGSASPLLSWIDVRELADAVVREVEGEDEKGRDCVRLSAGTFTFAELISIVQAYRHNPKSSDPTPSTTSETSSNRQLKTTVFEALAQLEATSAENTAAQSSSSSSSSSSSAAPHSRSGCPIFHPTDDFATPRGIAACPVFNPSAYLEQQQQRCPVAHVGGQGDRSDGGRCPVPHLDLVL